MSPAASYVFGDYEAVERDLEAAKAECNQYSPGDPRYDRAARSVERLTIMARVFRNPAGSP